MIVKSLAMFSVEHLQPWHLLLFIDLIIFQSSAFFCRFWFPQLALSPWLLIESLVSLTRWEVLNPDRWRQEVKTGSDQEPTIGEIVEAGLEMEQYCPCLTDRSPQPEIAEGTTYELKQCMLCYCNAQLYNCAKKSITLINTLCYPAAQIRSHWLL